LLARPASHAEGLYSLPVFLSFIFFFLTVALKTIYLEMYWTDLHQIFRIGTE